MNKTESNKKYYSKNKANIRKSQKEYYIDNKNILADKNKKYRELNKDILSEKKKEYYIKNKEERKLYYLNNQEKVKEYNKEYYQNNKNSLNEKRRIYLKNKMLNDNLFRLKIIMRIIIIKSIKNKRFVKNNKTEEIIGCSFIDLKNHLENQFEPWMNWTNYGIYNGEYKYGWDIDHIIELKTAKTEEEILKLNLYSNLRPLDSKINRVDRNKKYS